MTKQTKLATAIKLYLNLRNLSRNEVAIKAGVSETTFVRFLNGENIPNAKSMLKIINWALGDDSPGQD